MTTAGRVLSADALSHALEDLPVAATNVIAGEPVAQVAELGRLGDAEIGIWSLTPGTVTDTEADEVFVVLSGRGTVTFADESSVVLAPGAVVRLHAGERSTWTVTETIRKVYLTR